MIHCVQADYDSAEPVTATKETSQRRTPQSSNIPATVECTDDSKCKDPEKAKCHGYKCVSCSDDGNCAHFSVPGFNSRCDHNADPKKCSFQCEKDEDCPTKEKPICTNADGGPPMCDACGQDLDCERFAPNRICANRNCRECRADADCLRGDTNRTSCDNLGRCWECIFNRQCLGRFASKCDAASYKCVACDTTGDCAHIHKYLKCLPGPLATPYDTGTNSCRAECENDSDCPSMDLPACADYEGSGVRKCDVCHENKDCERFAADKVCFEHKCRECAVDADCSQSETTNKYCDGSGKCRECMGNQHCTEMAASKCDTASYKCVECYANADCAHLNPYYTCSGQSHAGDARMCIPECADDGDCPFSWPACKDYGKGIQCGPCGQNSECQRFAVDGYANYYCYKSTNGYGDGVCKACDATLVSHTDPACCTFLSKGSPCGIRDFRSCDKGLACQTTRNERDASANSGYEAKEQFCMDPTPNADNVTPNFDGCTCQEGVAPKMSETPQNGTESTRETETAASSGIGVLGILGIVFAVLLMLCICTVICCICKKKKKKESPDFVPTLPRISVESAGEQIMQDASPNRLALPVDLKRGGQHGSPAHGSSSRRMQGSSRDGSYSDGNQSFFASSPSRRPLKSPLHSPSNSPSRRPSQSPSPSGSPTDRSGKSSAAASRQISADSPGPTVSPNSPSSTGGNVDERKKGTGHRKGKGKKGQRETDGNGSSANTRDDGKGGQRRASKGKGRGKHSNARDGKPETNAQIYE